MNTNSKISLIAKLAAAAALVAAAPGAFAAANWTSGNLGSQCSGSQVVGTVANTLTCTANDQDGSGSAYVSSGTILATGWSQATSISTSGSTSYAATAWDHGASYGLGVINKYETNTTGPHGVDNINGVDSLMLKFQGDVSLSSITVGWTAKSDPTSGYTDSDFSIYAWRDQASSVSPTNGSGTGASLASGWVLVGNFANLGSNATAAIAASGIYSSYWLISAYSGATTATLDGLNDSFKVLAVAGSTCAAAVSGASCKNATPEPGSLALLGAGLFGMVALRRRQQGKA